MNASVVDTAALEWVNGADVFATMDPAFRDNIGTDEASALALLATYHAKCLWKDESTGRRIDHIRCEAGYRDLSEAYHDSVEECLVLGGSVELTAEGWFEPGDYFWRPPGWVHSAQSPRGFEAVLMMEGTQPCEGSLHVSRVVRPDADAGQHVAVADPVGPRGYVRRAESRHMPWRAHDDSGTLLGAAGLESKVLSDNPETGTETSLVRFVAGTAATPQAGPHERFVVIVDGEVVLDDGRRLGAGSLLRAAGGEELPAFAAPDTVVAMVKTCPAQHTAAPPKEL
ncbi:cupin domain-containing protein [Nocardioides yefusunii]|uniref:Cupin domain-containing protein n=1 Tax=Nocardioides yefusunii TaxID=2500546 RepID=A0ABW1QW46_9ACTN|nr:hypothetical protein [Nocardioides yefusunii]